MEYLPCPAPFSRYEVSKFGNVRRRLKHGHHYLIPYKAKHGAYLYALMRDRGNKTTVTATKLVRSSWPEQAFQASPQWLMEAQTNAALWNDGAPSNAHEPNTRTKADYDYCDHQARWQDANYCPCI